MAGQTGDTFGARLRQLREAAGLTQEALAEQAGLSLNAIGALERGDRRHPYPRTIHVLAVALGISEDERSALASLLPKRIGRVLQRNDDQPGSLPVATTPLLGREREVDEAASFLRSSDVRLLTLTGPGGVGKNRIAIRVASLVRDGFADGAWFVPLVQITDPGLVTSLIMQVLALQEVGETEPRDVLVQNLRGRNILLVLDNFEQIPDAAPLVADLLLSCPLIKVIVTSRTPLRVDGEQEFPVPPLTLPSNGVTIPLGELGRIPAVALFLQRAHAARPDFMLTEENAGAIVELCGKLDGLPLAIELAAARVKLLSPQAMLGLLSNRLRLLTGGGLDRPERLQTMGGAIAWSFNLLEPAEQTLFRRLSVFVGGCVLDAVDVMFEQDAELLSESETVRDPLQRSTSQHPDTSMLDHVATLVDHSLLLREERPDGEVRIRMLEVIREFSLERLIESGEADEIRQAHAAYFLQLVTNARERIEGPDRREAHEQIHRELDNLRAALAWLYASGNADAAQRMAIQLARFWIDLGYIGEGRDWMERVIAMPAEATFVVRAEALYWATGFANLQDDSARAKEIAHQALELARASDNQLGFAMALTELGEAVAHTDMNHARSLVGEALTTFRELDDPVREGMALGQLGRFAQRQNDHGLAADYHKTALTIWRRLDHPWGIPSALRDQAGEALVQGSLTTAWTLYQESLVRWQQLGERIHMSDCLSGLARVALASGRGEKAALLLGAEDALNETTGYVPSQIPHTALVDAMIAALGNATFDAAWSEGHSLSLEAVIDDALSMTVEG